MYYKGTILGENLERRRYPIYQTLPSKRTHQFQDDPERSVTPDITRGLERNSEYHRLGIPVKIPDVRNWYQPEQVPSDQYFPHISPHKTVDDIKISPIDPRNSGGFQSSTPSAKPHQDLKAAANLESRLLSPKKSTMSNEELYAVIHKSKKKMNISVEDKPAAPIESKTPPTCKSPETGYLGDKTRSRLSWSPTKGEYVDFNTDIDKLSPPNDSRSRQSWACSDRKGTSQTSRLDFKKLLLQKASNNAKKISAVEQLQLSKQQIQAQKSQPPPMSILELSGSPRSLVNRKFGGSPRSNPEKPKLMSPRSQWRFANPRTDVLSSTILEDCREDESPNNSIEKKKENKYSSPSKSVENAKEKYSSPNSSIERNKREKFSSVSQRIQAQRAQFFASSGTPPDNAFGSQFQSPAKDKCSVPPTLETAF